MTRKKGVFVLELSATTAEKGKPRKAAKMAMDIEEVDVEVDEEAEDDSEKVDMVGDGLWFRKMKTAANQGFIGQA